MCGSKGKLTLLIGALVVSAAQAAPAKPPAAKRPPAQAPAVKLRPGAVGVHTEAVRVALMPVVAVNVDAGNVDRITPALAKNLRRHGCRLIEPEIVAQAITELGIDVQRPLDVITLGRLGLHVGAEVLVYPRGLVQGPTARDGQLDLKRQAIIVNVWVADCRRAALVTSSEVMQVWETDDPEAEVQITTPGAAEIAADRLLRRLYPPVAVRGQLIDGETGLPAAGVEALLKQDGVPVQVALADERGAFAFKEPARGAYSVTTRSPRYYEASYAVPFRLEPQQPVVTLAPRAAAVVGHLRDTAAKPAANRPVLLLDASNHRIGRAVTLADGSFAFKDLKRGAYRISASLAGGRWVEGSVAVWPGDVAVVELGGR